MGDLEADVVRVRDDLPIVDQIANTTHREEAAYDDGEQQWREDECEPAPLMQAQVRSPTAHTHGERVEGAGQPRRGALDAYTQRSLQAVQSIFRIHHLGPSFPPTLSSPRVPSGLPRSAVEMGSIASRWDCPAIPVGRRSLRRSSLGAQQ